MTWKLFYRYVPGRFFLVKYFSAFWLILLFVLDVWRVCPWQLFWVCGGWTSWLLQDHSLLLRPARILQVTFPKGTSTVRRNSTGNFPLLEHEQWWIQDCPDGGALTLKVGAPILWQHRCLRKYINLLSFPSHDQSVILCLTSCFSTCSLFTTGSRAPNRYTQRCGTLSGFTLWSV